MSRIYNISWRQSDYQKLARAVKNFNAKLTRVTSKNADAADYLPDRESVRDIRNRITTRRDLEMELNKLKRFTKRGSEQVTETKQGIKLTKWQRNEIAIQRRIINLRQHYARQRAEDMPVVSEGKKTGLTRGQMGSTRLNELKPIKNDPDTKKASEWHKFVEKLEYQVTDKYKMQLMDHYKQNYLKALRKNFGSDADKIAARVESMPADRVVDLYYSNQEADIDYIYFEDAAEYDTKIETLEEIWGVPKDEEEITDDSQV